MIVRDLRSKVWFAIGPAQQSVERIEEDAGSTKCGDDDNDNDGGQ